MAEQEVIKHTKKIFTTWGSNKGFWHKLKEFLLEIIIIVFAISLSIYLHDRSVLKHQRHETKEFLLGLMQDLKTDIKEMNEDQYSFHQSSKAFGYITSVRLNEPVSNDSIKKYNNWIFNQTGLVPNSGRFEGFKSSGKIATITDKALQDNIMDLYQENIPNLINSTNNYSMKKQKLFEYLAANTKRTSDSTTNLGATLASDQAYNICTTLTAVNEIIGRYDICIKKMQEIIAEIEKEYGK